MISAIYNRESHSGTSTRSIRPTLLSALLAHP